MKNLLLQEIDHLQQEIASHVLTEREKSQIREYYRIGLTYTSNAIEGNSLTESETKVVLEEGITIGGKRLVDHFEAVGHSDAFQQMYTYTAQENFSEDDIKKLHHLFYYRINEAQAGTYRTEKVYITGSKYPLPDPQKIAGLMEHFIASLAAKKRTLHPVEFAAYAHKTFVFIHPFIDGNGRVARLLMNMALLQAGYNIAVIPPINRRIYFTALEHAHENDAEFIQFIAETVRETQRDYLRLFI